MDASEGFGNAPEVMPQVKNDKVITSRASYFNHRRAETKEGPAVEAVVNSEKFGCSSNGEVGLVDGVVEGITVNVVTINVVVGILTLT